MIPILFEATATNFDTYGIGVLRDATSCIVTEERNGSFELVLKYPTNGNLYSYIQNEKIIVAKPNDTKSNQAFRIYKITTPINGIITVYAQHISYDLAYIGVVPFSLSNVFPALTGQALLNNAVIDHPFTFQSEISLNRDFTIDAPKSIRNSIGGTKGSILDIWGGEFEWDNYRIIQHQSRGRNNGVVIEYGKNLTKLDHTCDIADTYTHLLPYAIRKDAETGEETVVTLPEEVLPISNTVLESGKVYIKDLTDKFGDNEEVTEYALRAKAGVWINEHPLGIETSSVKVSFEPLWKQKEYSAIHERVSLCDTVTVKHLLLGINLSMKVITTEYDVLEEKFKSITLGTAKSNLAVKMNEIEEEVQTAKKEVDRFPLLLTSAISSATKLITGNSGGCVVIHTNNEDRTPYELLILDNENIDEAVNVWRWNLGGLGFSSHGYNGPYETAITADGSIVANFITSGTLVANIIRAGILSSQDGSSYWNLETGEVHLSSYATTESVEQQEERINDIESKKMLRLVISSSNGNIFKNGNIATVLSATVYSWDEDITDTLDDNQFIWTRVSDDAEADVEWNHDHYGGTKQIEITNEDVRVRATFFCDLIDTTTRNSLLS